MPRILSISGLRGVIGDGLDPAYVAQFASALGTLTRGGRVVVSRDGRSTGPMLKHAVLAGLTATGCRVLDAGIAATPTCGVLVTHLNAGGGVQITASHNPSDWNGLKPFSREGSVFDDTTGRQLIDLLESQAFSLVDWDAVGAVEVLDDPGAPHLRRVLKLVECSLLRQRRFKVVLDCNHGSGAALGPRLLEDVGCHVDVLGGWPDGRFKHPPEPLEENLTGLCEAVKAAGADVGFAQDPDADRLAVVDERGRYVGEELTMALCSDFVLSRTPGPVVVNASTSRATADIAARYGCEFFRSRVGEAHVVAKMKTVSAVLGGEGNGGVIEPKVGFVRDSFVAMAYILSGMAARKESLSAWVDSLPQYAIVKDKLAFPREQVVAAAEALKLAFPDAEAQEEDGLRLEWPDRWLHVRASNTEPVVRLIVEAPDRDAATALMTRAGRIMSQAAG